MSKRSRIFLVLLLIYVAGTGFLLYRVLADLDPRYRESAEESLVETAQLVATMVEQDVRDGRIATERLGPLFESLYARRFEARIFSEVKTQVDLRLVVTDRAGRVLFDSLGRATGADHSRWNEILLALRGQYGARTSPDTPDRPETSVMYVAAPVRSNGAIVGAVSVGKPVHSFGRFVEAARRKTFTVGVLSALGVALLGLIMSIWVVRPLGLLTDFARYVRSQRRLHPASLARVAVGIVRDAFDDMRDALAGRNYVADYVQTLTHELKSPLSAIRGAAELLQDPAMPEQDRRKFLGNIAQETGRIQEVVDRMMELTRLEARRSLAHVAPVALGPLVDEVLAAARDAAAPRQVGIEREPGDAAVVEGDRFLLRRAIANIVDNAVDFSPAGAVVHVRLAATDGRAVVVVRDEGPGVPDYAREKVFEKFYSLARPDTGRKSTGLGLSFVRQVAVLHHGRVELANGEQGGAVATLSLPLLPSG
ncbi:two-component system sensor histidine kinase CreC [Ramlibacter sp. USB13]|uniref:histidine kinase n=1 Tax=Ramlibacter cellulosilyticus TaxID=2764187 RepID=A0A923MNS8_9BURK|nr:two-component system sensor histidine kinase CreC [Ramlibacter cellulosilyticus]